MNKYIGICQDFDGVTYQEFIKVIAYLSDAFTLVIDSASDGKNIEIGRFTQDMKPYCTGIAYEQRSWPGAGFGAPSNVYQYKVSADSIQLLLAHTNSLFDSFNGRTVPEDLSFTKNGEPVMITASHEISASVYPKSEEEISLIRSVQYISPYAIVYNR